MQASTPSPGRAQRVATAPQRLIAAALLLILAACGGSDDAAAPAAGPAVTSVSAVNLTLAANTLALGQTATLTAEAKDANGAVVPGAAFSWATSDSSVVTVAAGVATGVGAGTARITAASGGVTSDPVTLVVVAVANGSVAIDRASVFFSAVAQTRQLTALAADAQGGALATPVTWTSSAPDKVAVDASGRLMALAIGSAQITASSGTLRSPPTLVVVAEPQPGALLVGDAQVIAVGAPFAAPAASTQYEVTLQGVAAPAPGTVILAAESAPIAGKVVATRQDAAGLVVTVAVAPLAQLFSAYDIDWTIDLSAFPAEPTPTVQVALGTTWSNARLTRSRALAARPLDAVAPFKPFECDADITGKIGERKVSLSLDNKLKLVVHDKPGYSRHSLEGAVTLTGSASLKLNVGFEGSGKCEATGQIKLPVLGWFSVIVMPALRLGLGARIGGEVLFAQGELGVDGSVGADVVMGWECGGATPQCRSLDSRTPSNKFETRSKFPSVHDMQVKVSGQFYVLAGFDLAFFLGAANAKIVEARAGPTQSFDLAFENDQAFRPDYASHYELTLDAVIEPGPALAEAIKRVIDDDAVGVKFKLEATTPLSESPKGTLVADKTRVAIGAPIVFTVDLDPATVAYAVIGYNVTGLELYRKRDDESKFTPWKAMTMVTELRGTYTWTPETADAGNYEFAAFVNTEIQPLPWLEVEPNSVKKVEVSCFTAGILAAGRPGAQVQASGGNRKKPLAPTCADTWAGTSSLDDSLFANARANVTWTVDPTHASPENTVTYRAEGSIDITFTGSPGCSASPSHFVFAKDDPKNVSTLLVHYDASPPAYGGSAFLLIDTTVTCPGGFVTNYRRNVYWFASSGGRTIGDGLVIDISGEGMAQPGTSYHFERP